MKKSIVSFLCLFSLVINFEANAQIYAPEGINMPGSWDSWVNPPTNDVFAGIQGAGTLLLTTGLGVNHYQTIFSTPTNVAGGSYQFLFSTGPASNYWQNKWADLNVVLNTIQTYTYNGTVNNSIVLNDNKFYVMNWEDIGYDDTRAIFMELNAAPVTITNVSQDISVPDPGQGVVVTITTSQAPGESLFLRFTTDDWGTSSLNSFTFTDATGTALIPGLPAGTDVEYYIFSTNQADLTGFTGADMDLVTINFDNNNGLNYTYSVPAPLTCEGQTGVLITDPDFPLQEGPVSISFDATMGNGALSGYLGDVYAHTGVITSESNGNNDWRYVVTDWGENTVGTLFTNVGTDLYELSIDNIRTYFGVPSGEDIYKIAMVIRSGEPIDPEEPDNFYVARNADGSDMYVDVYDEGLHVKLLSPSKKDPLVPLNSLIPVCVVAMDATSIFIYVDDVLVHQESGLETMYALNTGDYEEGMHEIVAKADDSDLVTDTTRFYIRGEVVVEELPVGMKNGINYISNSEVTLVLQDPSLDKEFAFVIGDFNNWTASDQGYMKRTPDGTKYWTSITGLTPGVEYAYQYYIDGESKLADPYCDKILDPWNDRWIPETTYPNLKDYPWDLTIGTVSVFQTAQPEFSWVIDDFTPVAVNATQSNLIIYELLVRDFVESRDIKDVMDTLDYLENLGVNAIELMPIAEFDGNDSWGYAPNFYYATDKAYGTKNDYKLFIDECHQRGIAVILDVVYNHMYGGSPFVQMYWDSENAQPAANSAWFNQTATHPYSIGYDFNHESTHTRNLIKDNLSYWMNEYKVDGFRFDLSKGFTQTYTGGDVGAWSQYDQSRIDIISDYYNHIKSVNPDAYVILEHFANNNEEVVLANTGCLLWGQMNESFNQNTMGWESGHDFSWAYYSDRGFTFPNLIPFMESHDEERQMFRNIAYGNGFAGDTTVALDRTEAIVPMYFTVPGPKMIWQFGEIGYDESIELCGDGSYSEECRTSAKPIHWEYMNDLSRQRLYWTYAGMAKLKTENEAYRNGTFGKDLSGMGKRMWVSHASLNVSVSANFAVTGFSMAPAFQHTGTWYNYFTGEQINVTDAPGHTLYYNPGDYYVFTDVQLNRPYAGLTFNVKNSDGQNLQNALVTIHGYSNTNTDASGNAQFLFGTNSVLNYTVSKSGYYPVNAAVTMGTDDLTEYVVLQPTVDIEDFEKKEINIFPNPVDRILCIQTEEAFDIRISTITGSLLKCIKSDATLTNVDVSDLTPGLYTVIMKNHNQVYIEKIIVK